MLVCSDDVCLAGITNQNSPEINGPLAAGAAGARRADTASVMRLKSSSESGVRAPSVATPAAEDVPPSPDELEVPSSDITVMAAESRVE